jgi:hypothetical protein
VIQIKQGGMEMKLIINDLGMEFVKTRECSDGKTRCGVCSQIITHVTFYYVPSFENYLYVYRHGNGKECEKAMWE